MTTLIRPLAYGVHLVGSVPLASSEAVFRTLTAEIGDRLRRIPDGETGPRSDWIVWQLPVFTTQQQLEVVPPGPSSWRPLLRVRVTEGTSPDRIVFGALGYADAAIASYRVFARLKRDGLVPVACRFQVCLPTPLAPLWCPSTRRSWSRHTKSDCWPSCRSSSRTCPVTSSPSSGTRTSNSGCWKVSSPSGSAIAKAASWNACSASPGTCRRT